MSDELTGATVRRSTKAPGTSPTSDRTTSADAPRRRAVIFAAAAVALIAAVGLSIAFGSGSGEEPAPTTRRARIEPQDPGFESAPAALPTPTDLTATPAADGSVRLTWTMPEVDTDRSSIGYRVVRTDSGDPDENYGTFDKALDVPELTISAEDLGPSSSSSAPCFMVTAVAGSIQSETWAEVCVS